MINVSRDNRDALNIFIIFIFSISQPIVSLLANNILFFIARRSDLTEIVYFTLLIFLILPCLVAALYLAAAKAHRLIGRVIGSVLLSVGAYLFLAPLLANLSISSGAQTILLNLMIALSFTGLYYYSSACELT